ncbi:hypothetical protein EMIHUDRAFT_226292 [Emiliania huxleyi CCMP1516]|uniref:Amino acid transporter transmembrane domain-containing protein n=2 Tax=Emiliania huxleyi TaxID=2903 RepID=A0A0D3KL88_EMIH1|nr:hypothetical protein EMIHUDRAFT_226292 [Emiliania huxleyi CCMP1516]EOD36523.1 hypothetical protein EMIHUDRAFT_226292 [Emiliania huxleyi CCMP1516]|eukprot:XP_005788952.1 hypothetical protein EMIHUDRAFT_226292 [Emiliania huxleyi CCMP1516]
MVSDDSHGRLGVVSTALLLVADCVGTGVLGLPAEVDLLGPLGLLFLALQIPVNAYVGGLLNAAATRVDDGTRPQQGGATANILQLTRALFGAGSGAARATAAAWYLNLFLVLGNYLVVMGSAVQALAGGLCAYQASKLLLNIRAEMREPARADAALRLALALYGAIYLAVVLLCGPSPPGLLLDAWLLLTTAVTALAWVVANAVPFFQDLAPLTLLLPALLYRRAAWPLNRSRNTGSAAVVVVSAALVAYGTLGAVGNIISDWHNHGTPFSCALPPAAPPPPPPAYLERWHRRALRAPPAPHTRARRRDTLLRAQHSDVVGDAEPPAS